MRAISRLSPILREFSAQAGKTTKPKAPVDPLSKVVGEFIKGFCVLFFNSINLIIFQD